MWEVYAYINPKAPNQNGKGDRCIRRRFDDQPTAHRFAKAIVECGPARHARVEEVSE